MDWDSLTGRPRETLGRLQDQNSLMAWDSLPGFPNNLGSQGEPGARGNQGDPGGVPGGTRVSQGGARRSHGEPAATP